MVEKKSHWPLTILGGSVSLLNLFLPLLLVRILTPNEIGQYKVYFLYSALIPWLCLSAGINNGLSHCAGHETKFAQASRASWTISLTIGILALVLGTVFKNHIEIQLGWNSLKTNFLIFGVFASILANFFEDASIARGKILRGALFNSGFDLARNCLMAASAYRFRTVEAVFAAHIGLVGIKLLFGSSWGWYEGFQKISLNISSLKEVFRYAFPVSLGAVFSIANGYSDQLLLSRFLVPEEFAVYSFGCLLIPPLIIFEQSVNRVLIPKMSRVFLSSEPRKAMLLFEDAVSELSWLMVPAGVALIVFSEPIVELLFTKRYIGASIFLRMYAINYLINVLPYDSVARAKGDGKWILRRLAIFSIISFTSVFVLAKNFGAVGALSGSVICNFLMKSSSMFSVHRSECWPLREMLPWRHWKRYYGFALLGGGVAMALRSGFESNLRWFVVGGIAFTLTYMIGTISIFLRRRDMVARLIADIS